MRKLSKIYPFALALSALAPLVASAQTAQSILQTVKAGIDYMIPLIMALAVLVFLWGVVKYITAGGDAEKEKTARGYIIYGLIGIFVLVAFWGIIQILTNTFGIETGGTLPQVRVPF